MATVAADAFEELKGMFETTRAMVEELVVKIAEKANIADVKVEVVKLGESMKGAGEKMEEFKKDVVALRRDVDGAADDDEVSARFQELEEKIDGLKQTQHERKEPKKWDVTEKKSYNGIPDYTGDVEKVESWKRKFLRFMQTVESMKEMMLWAEKMETEMTEEKLKAWGEQTGTDVAWLDNQLFVALSLKTTGSAQTTVDSFEEEEAIKGVLAWRQSFSSTMGAWSFGCGR